MAEESNVVDIPFFLRNKISEQNEETIGALENEELQKRMAKQAAEIANIANTIKHKRWANLYCAEDIAIILMAVELQNLRSGTSVRDPYLSLLNHTVRLLSARTYDE
jgi:hypothetical protein